MRVGKWLVRIGAGLAAAVALAALADVATYDSRIQTAAAAHTKSALDSRFRGNDGEARTPRSYRAIGEWLAGTPER